MSINFSILGNLEKLYAISDNEQRGKPETSDRKALWKFAISAICFIALVLAIILSGGE